MMEFTFEQSPWEKELARLEQGSVLSAARFLSLTDGEDEQALEDAFLMLEDRHITLDVSDLPVIAAGGETALRLRQEQQLVKEGDLLTGLEETDPLRLYLEELVMIPAAGDICLLAQRYLDGDESAVQMLTNLSLHRLVSLAEEMTGRGVLLLDLIQEASLGLWQGILQYTGGDFESHRDWWIRQYLARAVVTQARSGGLGQKLRQGMEDYRDVDQRLLSELGRNPTLEEIAEAMHITPEDAAVYESMVSMAKNRQAVDLTRQPERQQEEEDQAVEDTAYFQMRQRIAELLSGLSEQDARLLTLRYGLEGGLPLNPAEVGAKLGLTAEEVVKREAAALAALRKEN